MSPRVGRLGFGLLFAGLLAGCSLPRDGAPRLRPGPAATVAPAGAAAAAGQESVAPRELSTLLLVTAQVAHADIFVHAMHGVGPRYQPATRLYRGQRAFVLPFVRGYGRDAAGAADVGYELAIRKADGSPDGTPVAGIVWRDKVPSSDLTLFPASLITFWTEPTDPLGPYEFTARVRDAVTGREETLTRVVEIVDYQIPTLPADFEPETWFNTYYLQPSPELALPALRALFAAMPADRYEAALPPLLGFYDQLLADNAWLLPAFGRRLLDADSDEAFALSLVLAYHLRSAATAAAAGGLSSEVRERVQHLAGYDWPSDSVGELVRPAQLDELWGRFFASGLYEPVGRLVAPLAHAADLGAVERWQAASTANGEEATAPDLDDPDLPDAVRREVVLRAALWSLLSNAGRHPLVAGYLRWSVASEAVDPAARELLRRALAEAASAKTSAQAPAASSAPDGS